MNSLRALTSLSSAAAAAKASTSPRLAAASAFVAARPPSSICTAKRSSAESPLHLLRKQQRNFTQSSSLRALGNPVNIPKWLEENGHLLKPPVNNYCVYDDGYTVMIVGGPNERSDYHINETPEWFYQYKGSMLLRVVDSGEFRDIDIHQGEMFYLPANVPHNPVRFADTVGIVIEQRRPDSSLDRLRWYCQNCHEQVHEAAFHCTDLGTQIKTAVEAFKGDLKTRTCKNCGTVCDVVPPKRS